MAAPEYKLFPGIKPSEASWFCVTNLDGFEIAAAYDVMRRCDPAKFAAYFSDSHVLTNLAYMYPELMKTFPDLPWNRMRIAELNKKQAVMSDDEILAQFSGTVEKASFARKPVADAVQSVLGNQIRLATEAGQLVQQADATVRTEKQTATQND